MGLPIAPEGRGKIPPQAGGLFFCRRDRHPNAVLRCIWKSHTLPISHYSARRVANPAAGFFFSDGTARPNWRSKNFWRPCEVPHKSP